MSTITVLRARALTLALSLASLVAGCGETFEDADFGGVDLIEFFWDTGVNGEPPANYFATEGWLNGERAFYYDFGAVAVRNDHPSQDVRAELAIGRDDKIPKSAPVNPMYFFFDQAGNPMFSRPVKESRTGRSYMPGGLRVRNINPRANANRNVAYAIRARDLYVDTDRKVADYQRPIIDVIFDREDLREDQKRYSGIWEFVKVKAPSGYAPDAIKSFKTLDEAWAQGEGAFEIVQTGLLVNCPLVDSRSVVVPNVSVYEHGDLRSPQPLIELWYRKKRTDCFLVNGWETLGMTEASQNRDGNDKYTLFKWAEDSRRVATIDVEVEILGVGKARRLSATAPVGRLYIPVITAGTEAFFYPLFLTSGALPRRKKDDPPGYRPIRWWWNVDVLDLPQIGAELSNNALAGAANQVPALTNPDEIDASQLSPRIVTSPDGSRRSLARNFPLSGKRISCLVPDATAPDGVRPPATPAEDVCRPIGLTCGNFQAEDRDIYCQEPNRNYGEYCAQTIAKCWNRVNKPAVRPDGGETEILYRGDVVDAWFFQGQIPTSPPELVEAFQNAMIPPDILDERERLRQQSSSIGWIDNLNQPMYRCLGDHGIGHCYLGCKGNDANVLQGETMAVKLTVNGSEVEHAMPLDSRCGGRRMPGFRCLPVTNDTADTGGRVCVRDCSSGEPATLNDAACQYPTPMWLSEDKAGKDGFDIARDTHCLNTRSPDSDARFDACIKDVAFEPHPE